MRIDPLHKGVGVEIFDKGFDFFENKVFSIRCVIVDGDHKADMADMTFGLERTNGVLRQTFGETF